MGQEVVCTARIGNRKASGKALLETAEVIFRPADGARSVKIPFASIKSATAAEGELRLQTPDGPAVFVLGPAAEKWREKILHPKTRAEKLGVKPAMNVSLLGAFDVEFLQELRGATKNLHEDKLDAGSELIFLSVAAKKDLLTVAKLARSVKGAVGLWIVYPKGKRELNENDIIAAGRKAGLKDVKVVGFSPSQTSLKFVVPLDKR
jgi:hypothetical protein